ncbi:MAG: class I SAM-dependent methyltransferase [Gemmatimonadaceae bacterium]|nr:class I SAM-dependent methyltransferase [Gemmatimonadaceae bacterium]
MTADGRIGSSFRDPSGFLFTANGVLLRQVQERYRPHYQHLRASGLYDALVRDGLLVAHEERPLSEAAQAGAAFVLRPERIPFISLPYEWSFGQRRAAALLTLRIQRLALSHGMTLKDASAFNVQFRGGKPVLIDTLSFERREPGAPWIAYRQFCQHFLAPLALQAMVDVRLGLLLRQYVDGIPLDLASRLLPGRTKFSMWAQFHIHLHAKSIARHSATKGRTAAGSAGGAAAGATSKSPSVSDRGIEGLVLNLEGAVQGLSWSPPGTEWGAYEENLGYANADREAKHAVVGDFVKSSGAKSVLDLGANAGEYSRVARGAGASLVVAADGDPVAVERHFRRLEQQDDPGIVPVWVDLTNPSPSQGWDHAEWPSLAGRGPFDAVMALALVHHLAIGNNVPLPGVAAMLARLGRQVIVEWVPKTDPQVQRLLSAREDIFGQYAEADFRQAFAGLGLRALATRPVGNSGRVLYRFGA